MLLAMQSPPPFMYIYRDYVKPGVDSAYAVLENEGAQICADFKCPNPYIGMESLTGPHEAWWLNTFASVADTARVSRAYQTDNAMNLRLRDVAVRKGPLI